MKQKRFRNFSIVFAVDQNNKLVNKGTARGPSLGKDRM